MFQKLPLEQGSGKWDGNRGESVHKVVNGSQDNSRQ